MHQFYIEKRKSALYFLAILLLFIANIVRLYHTDGVLEQSNIMPPDNSSLDALPADFEYLTAYYYILESTASSDILRNLFSPHVPHEETKPAPIPSGLPLISQNTTPEKNGINMLKLIGIMGNENIKSALILKGDEQYNVTTGQTIIDRFSILDIDRDFVVVHDLETKKVQILNMKDGL